MTADDGLVGDVLQDHGLADAVGADEHGVVTGGKEAEAEEVVDGLAVDFLGPGPVEVGHGLKLLDLREA